MALPTLAIASLVDLAAAVLFCYIGAVVARRPVPADSRAASLAFAAWWFGIGGNGLLTGARGIAAAFGLTDRGAGRGVFLALYVLAILLTIAAVCGLLFYLLYLFTGRRGLLRPLVAFYTLYALVALYALWRLEPSAIVAGKWFAQVTVAHQDALGGALLGILVALLLLPQIGGAIAYLTLYPRVRGAEQRFRVLLVSLALLVWLGSALAAPMLRLGEHEWWQAGGRLVGLTAAIVVLIAYRPPRLVRERLAAADRREGTA